MQHRLYPGNHQQKDPIRLAEEYRVVLGEPALEGLIREMITDEEWLPGVLHKKLVKFPWVDILTTNWDTLLERAASSVIGQAYETVRCLEDVATTRAPRIVKLHGSLPSNRPFILSEEDYRTYPRLFAPFVNLVQQALLENELCLLGFSGDDPNFLAWTGWIRDQLGSSARRMYLAGAFDLKPAQRRLLELRNISVIDLHAIVEGGTESEKQRSAMELLLQHLEGARPRAPWVWPKDSGIELKTFQRDAEKQADYLRTLTERWSQQRADYPGWAICPDDIRTQLKYSTVSHAELNQNALQQLNEREQSAFVFELVWRLDTALLSIPEWMQEKAEHLSQQPEHWANQQERRFVQIYLLKRARETGRASFAELLQSLQADEGTDSDLKAAISHEVCLKAFDELDFQELEKHIDAVTGREALWGLRRAALLSNVGRLQEATASAEQVLADLYEKFYRNRASLWVLSRLAWADFCRRQYRLGWDRKPVLALDELDGLQSRIHETKCDPWDTIQGLERKTDEDVVRYDEQAEPTLNKFDPGVYRDTTRTIRFGGWHELALSTWQRVADHIGMPVRVEHLDVLKSRMERAERIQQPESIEDYHQILHLIQAGGDKTLERRFGRLQVAMLASDIHASLMKTVLRAFDFAIAQLPKEQSISGGFWSGRAAAYMEVLSRLIVRSKPGEARELWQKGFQFAKSQECRSRDLFEPLNNLMQRSASAIPPAEKKELILEAVDFPLPDEKAINGHFANDWPIAAQWLPEETLQRPVNSSFALRVLALIGKVRDSESQTRSRAALWLVHLHAAGALSEEEGKSSGDALWSRRDSGEGFPADTMLRPFVFLEMPGHAKNSTVEMLKQRNKHPTRAEYFIAVAQSTRTTEEKSGTILYTSAEALERLDEVLKWKPDAPPSFDITGVEGENRKEAEALGAYLANGILPVLTSAELTPVLKNAILGAC